MTKFVDSQWDIWATEECKWCLRACNLLTQRFISFNLYYLEDNPDIDLNIEIYPTIFRDDVKIGSTTALEIYLNNPENDR